MSGNTVVIGAFEALSYSGKAYVYTFDGTSWVNVQTLSAPDAASFDFFGYALAISGNTIAVGAYGQDTGGSNAGSVYVFSKNGDGWAYQQTLKPDDVSAGDSFGFAVALDGDTLACGAPFNQSAGWASGVLYVYQFDGTAWTLGTKLVASDAASGDKLGSSVAVSGSLILTGAPFWDDDSGITNRGAAYPFFYDGTTWQEQPKLIAVPPYGWYDDSFGNAVSLVDGTALVGAQLADGPGHDGGHVYTYHLQCSQSTSGCTSNGECDDGNVCTTDTCSNGTCQSFPNNNTCNDGDACTTGDVCSAGACSGTPLNCDDGITCTIDQCVSGACVHDASACECISNSDCSDGNVCTSDLCTNGSCSHINIVTTCDDGNACTSNDTCSAGTCVGTPIDCDDGNACTTDTCSNGTCRNVANTNTCDDGDACTTDDVCSAGTCVGTPLDCDDGIACTVDRCVSGTCRNNSGACDCSIDKDCDDGKLCTVDLCGSDRMCYHDTLSSCCGNGLCEKGESACTCSADCEQTGGAVCGNALCEAGDGEDCLTCPTDCHGVQSGPLRGQFCCGAGGGTNPINCDDSRCYDRSARCTNQPVVEPCCGNGVCEPYESGCFCPEDCGAPLAFESAGTTCQDRIDNDCDGLVDCEDPDCKKEPLCWTCDEDGLCDPGEDCHSCPSDCAGLARGRRIRRFCCGNGVREAAERDPAVCDGNP